LACSKIAAAVACKPNGKEGEKQMKIWGFQPHTIMILLPAARLQSFCSNAAKRISS